MYTYCMCTVYGFMYQSRVVKLSSPYLNVLIVVGIIMYYIDVILFGVDEGTPASRCTVNALCMVSHEQYRYTHTSWAQFAPIHVNSPVWLGRQVML